MITADHR